MTVKNCDRHSGNFITLRYVHKDVAYYRSELAAVQESLQRWLDQEVNGSTGENIPAKARTLLAEANKFQQEMQSLEDYISKNRRTSWVFNSGTRRQLRRTAEGHIDATREKLRAFSALCDGAVPDLGKPQKFEALKTVEEGGRRIIDLFQTRKLNLVGVFGPADVGKMAVVREVERLIGKDEKFRHHVVWVDLGVRCDSIEKAQRKIRSALGILQFPRLDPTGRDHQSALDLLVSLNVREEILVRAKVLLNRTSASATDPDGAAEKLLKTLKATKDLTRAGQLMRKLIALGPTLVILNDVWFSLEYLELVGIPMRKDCRVMVVSHSREIVFKKMKCQAIVELPELAQTAEKPLSVLNNIEMGIVRNIRGYNDFTQVFEHLTEDAKSILFLCCLFPPRYGITIEELARFSVTGQILKPDGDVFPGFQATRERIPKIATELSDSHLLSHENEQQLVVMMPDAVHTWARRMISRKYPGRRSFLLAASGDIDQTLFEKLDLSLSLLTLRGNIQSLQGIQSLSTNLKSLHMEHCKLLNSDNGNHDLIKLIGQLTQLEILSFSGSDIQHLPMELGGLKNLKLLDLSDCTDLQSIPANLIPSWCNLEELYIGDFKNWSEPLAATTWRSASIEEVVDLPCLVTLFLTATINQLPSNCVFPTRLQRYRILINGNTQMGGNGHAYPIPTAVSAAIRISSFPVLSLCVELFSKVEYLNLKDIAGLRSIIRVWSLPALKFLVIEDCRDLEYLVDGTSTSVLSNLQHLELINLEKFTCLVEGYGGLDLQHLETLIIKDCFDIEEIFAFEQLPIQLLKLQTIELKNLSKLTRIFSMPIQRKSCVEDCPSTQAQEMTATSSIAMPILRKLCVEDCPNLESLLPSTQAQEMTAACLETIELKNLSKLTRICSKGTSSIAMPILRKLCVEDCPNLESSDVTLPSTQAKEMLVACTETIDLKNLSKFKRTRTRGISSITMPILHKLCVEVGPNLESSDVILPSTQAQEMPTASLETLILGGEFRKRVEKPGDLSIGNFTPFKFQPGYLYTNLKHLELRGLPLEQLWKDESQIIALQTLTDLRVIECKELRFIFTAAICRNMPQLRNLKISECHKLEQIIEEDEMFSSSDAQSIICFPNLTDLEVSGCPELPTIFPISITHLPKLKTLSIKSCEKLTCVFQAKCIPDDDTSKEQLQEKCIPNGTSKEQILELPQLQELKLNSLKNLKAFTSQGFEFTLTLKTHEVKDCPLIGDSLRNLEGVRHEGSALDAGILLECHHWYPPWRRWLLGSSLK